MPKGVYDRNVDRNNGYEEEFVPNDFDRLFRPLFSRADRLREHADEIERIAAMTQSILNNLPDEPDTVIFFKKRFADGITYTYAAVAFQPYAVNERTTRWATTGPRAPKYYTTTELVAWMVGQNGIEELWVATEFTEV